MVDDAELLRRYAHSGSQESFTEFVDRHLNVVYFAALRRTNGNAALTQEISQYVFSEVARHAEALARHSTLTGWLHTATRHAAAKAMRAEETRKRYEQNTAMHELTAAEPAQEWERLRPVIDDALDSLDNRDREAILIRFFEGQAFAEVGATLRISHDAARMRVDRALDKLRLKLEQRGIKSVSAALAVVLATQGGVAAPAGMMASVSSAAAAAGVASAGATTLIGFMSSAKITLAVTSIAAALATAFLVERNRSQRAEATVAAVSNERAALESQLARTRASLQAAEIRAGEAEKDTAKLLEALPAALAKQPSASAKKERGALGDLTASLIDDLKKRYAKHRDEEFNQRAKIAADVRSLDHEAAFRIKLNAVEGYVAAGAFQAAKIRLREAILERPAEEPLTDSVKQLRAFIDEQVVPVEVTFTSDAETVVALASSSYMRIMPPTKNLSEKIPPGNYEVFGRRKGYQDVVIPIQVRSGVPPPTVNVICTVPAL